MRYLLALAAFLFCGTATAGLLEFHGGEFTSSIASNFAPTVVETSPLGNRHNGPQYSEFGYLGRASVGMGIRDWDEDYASMQMTARLEGSGRLFAGEYIRTDAMSLSGWWEFTTTRDLELDWHNAQIPAPEFTLNGEPIEFTRIPLTEREHYFMLLPAGRHRVEFSAMQPFGDMNAISTISLSIPEPSSLVLLLGGVVLAVAAKRYPLVLRSSNKRAAAV